MKKGLFFLCFVLVALNFVEGQTGTTNKKPSSGVPAATRPGTSSKNPGTNTAGKTLPVTGAGSTRKTDQTRPGTSVKVSAPTGTPNKPTLKVTPTIRTTAKRTNPPPTTTTTVKTTTEIVKNADETTRKSAPVCPEAPLIQNGEIVFIDSGIVVYGCKVNFALVGSKTIECKEDGFWSEKPYCERVTTPAPSTPTPPKTLTPRLATLQNNRVVTTQRTPTPTPTAPKPGSTQSARNNRLPSSPGTTAKPGPIIQLGTVAVKGVCPDPPAVDNATIVFTDPGILVVYSCTGDLVLVGDSNVLCQLDGTWSERPICIKETSCGHLPVVDGAVVSESNLVPGAMSRVGSYAVFTCPKLGTNIRVECLLGGSWSTTPNCASKPPPRATTAPPTTRPTTTPAPVVRICPNRPVTHLVFLFDLLSEEESADGQQRVILNYLQGLTFRQKMSFYSDGNTFTLAAVAIFETTNQGRPTVSTTLTISPELSGSAVSTWSTWLETNVLLMNNAFDDDIAILFESIPNVVGLGSIPLTFLSCDHGLSNVRIVYVSNAKRGAAIVRAASDSHSIKVAGGKIFVIGVGSDMASQRQQTVLKMRIATQPNYFKHFYAPDSTQLEGLMSDSDYLDFLRSGTVAAN